MSPTISLCGLSIALLCMVGGCGERKEPVSPPAEQPVVHRRVNLPEGEYGYAIELADGTRCVVVYGAYSRPSGISCQWRP